MALIFDVDSSHADTYGNQENSACNAHYRIVDFHPLVAFDGLTGDFKGTITSLERLYVNGVVDFIRPLINNITTNTDTPHQNGK